MLRDIQATSTYAAPVEGGLVYAMHAVDVPCQREGAAERIRAFASKIYHLRLAAHASNPYGTDAYQESIIAGDEGRYVAIGQESEPGEMPFLAYALRAPLRSGSQEVVVPEIMVHPELLEKPDLYEAVGRALLQELFSTFSDSTKIHIHSRRPSLAGRKVLRGAGLQYRTYTGSRAIAGFRGTVGDIRGNLVAEDS